MQFVGAVVVENALEDPGVSVEEVLVSTRVVRLVILAQQGERRQPGGRDTYERTGPGLVAGAANIEDDTGVGGQPSMFRYFHLDGVVLSAQRPRVVLLLFAQFKTCVNTAPVETKRLFYVLARIMPPVVRTRT